MERKAADVAVDGMGLMMANASLLAPSAFSDDDLPAHLSYGEEYDDVAASAWDMGSTQRWGE